MIFLDWYVTLSRTHYWEQLRTDDPRAYGLLSAWLLDNMDVFNEWMRGSLTSQELMARQARELGLEAEYVHDALLRSCELLTIEVPELLDEVARLRQKGVKILLATDNILEFTTITVPAQGILDHFDGVLNSAERRVLKGDNVTNEALPFFDDYMTRANTHYGDAVLIDDSDVYTERYPDTKLRQLRVRNAQHTHEILKQFV